MPSKITSRPSIREAVFNKYNGRCSYCGCGIEPHYFDIDHYIPKRRKMDNCYHGSDKVENFMPSCKSCNSSKNCKDLEDWREEISYKSSRLLESSPTYNLLVRFGLVKLNPTDIIFHFETIDNNE